MKNFLRTNKLAILIVILLYIAISIGLNFINNSVTSELADKTWMHRVNSTTKLKEVSQKGFLGIEVDVVFLEQKNVFDVNHPPAKSIDLSLLDYLSSLTDIKKHHFWIDLKNLTALNAYTSVSRLDAICKTLSLKKNHFIIESDKPQFLKIFQDSGYKTSYYLPNSLCSLPDDQRQEEFNILTGNIEAYVTDYISLDKCNYLLIAEKFPHKAKLLWSFSYKRRLTINPLHLLKLPNEIALKRRLLEDKNVEVVLFKYTAQQGNR